MSKEDSHLNSSSSDWMRRKPFSKEDVGEGGTQRDEGGTLLGRNYHCSDECTTGI